LQDGDRDAAPTIDHVMTPVGAALRGAVAGVAGTAAMDAFLYGRYRLSGEGDSGFLAWEFQTPQDWEQAPAPAQIGRRLYEGLLRRPLDARWARLANAVMHWGYGAGWASLFGLVTAPARRRRPLGGVALGVGVFGASYTVLPLLRLYKPIWEYAPHELAPDAAAHAIYGASVERAFALMAR
jgi:hypothetical protein